MLTMATRSTPMAKAGDGALNGAGVITIIRYQRICRVASTPTRRWGPEECAHHHQSRNRNHRRSARARVAAAAFDLAARYCEPGALSVGQDPGARTAQGSGDRPHRRDGGLS